MSASRRKLATKYAELARLRDERASGTPTGAHREALRALASAFPGALVDLERLPREVIEARRAELDRLAPDEAAPLWAIASERVHGAWQRALELRAQRPNIPGQRMRDQVHAEVAAELGIDRAALEALLWPRGIPL